MQTSIQLNAIQKLKRLINTKQIKGVKTSKEGYKTIFLKRNPYLKTQLILTGFFEFHTTNKGHIVSLHQIVAFLYKGYKALNNGFTVTKNIHVHHLDSNPSNNTPGNLVYLSSQEHLLVTQACTLNTHHINVPTPDLCPFNSQGLPILYPIQRLAYITSVTIRRTFKSLGVVLKISKHSILREIPNCLGIKRINWCPKFVGDIIISIQRKLFSDNSSFVFPEYSSI